MTEILLTKWNPTGVLVEVLQQCVVRGMQPPLIMCAISPNGSVRVTRWPEGRDPELLVEHLEPDGFALPMTLLVFDRRNNAARVTLTAQGNKVWH
jgi:hypothetical protein